MVRERKEEKDTRSFSVSVRLTYRTFLREVCMYFITANEPKTKEKTYIKQRYKTLTYTTRVIIIL